MSKSIYSADHKQIVVKLRKLRLAAGLDQIEVAKMLGKSQSYISKIESGQRRIDLIQLKQLAKIYKKDITYLL